MNQKRNTTVDFLRGLAMVLIILIHVTVYFRSDRLAQVLWEYSQVAVPIFIFCSGYIYFSKSKAETLNIGYFSKRIKRLVIPYYAYLIFFFLYALLFRQSVISLKNMVQKILFLNISSRDLDWLVVLFLYFMVIMPLIRFLSKRPRLLWIYGVLSFSSGVLLLFVDTQHAFRLIMWLPWSIVMIVTYLVVRYEHTSWFFRSAIFISSGIYLVSKSILLARGDTLVLTENKYPPNIYYLSYGIFLMLILYVLYRRYGSSLTLLQKSCDFLSHHSYSIFFIHFLILEYFLDFTEYKKLEWWGLFGAVFGLTIVVQFLFNYFFSILKRGPTI